MEYKQPKNIPVPNTSGYPNNAPKTQTAKIRGTGAAKQGTKFNNKTI